MDQKLLPKAGLVLVSTVVCERRWNTEVDEGIARKTKGIQGPTIKCKGLPEDSKSVIRILESKRLKQIGLASCLFFAGAKASGKQSEMRMQDNTIWEQNDKFIGDTWNGYEEYWVIKNGTRRSQTKRGWWNAGPEALVNRMVCEYTTGAYANIMGIGLKSN